MLVLNIQILACRTAIKWLSWAAEGLIFILIHTEMTTHHHQHNGWLLVLPWVKQSSQPPMPCGLSHLLLHFLAVLAPGFEPYHYPAGAQFSFQKLQSKCPPSGTCPHTYYRKLLLHKPLSSLFYFLPPFAKCNDFDGWGFFKMASKEKSLLLQVKQILWDVRR